MPPYASPGDRFSDSLPNQLTKPPAFEGCASNSESLSLVHYASTGRIFFAILSARQR